MHLSHLPHHDKVIPLAYEKASKGSLDEALTLLRRAADERDPAGKRMEAMGFILFQHGRWDEAAWAFSQARKYQPGNMSWLFYLACALARADKWDQAMLEIDSAMVKAPQDIAPLCARCLLQVEKQDLPAARSSFAQAAALYKARPYSQNAYGLGLLDQCEQSLTSA